jgi:hypothetical protein
MTQYKTLVNIHETLKDQLKHEERKFPMSLKHLLQNYEAVETTQKNRDYKQAL